METIGERIRRVRKEKGLTQNELGASFGGDKMLICKYEKNKVKDIPLDNIVAMAHALDIHPGYFLGMMDLEEAKASRRAFASRDVDERESLRRLVVAASHLSDAQIDALTTIAEQMRR